MSLALLAATGFLLNAAAALVALWRGWVDPGGAVAGLVVGGLIFAAGGPLFWAVLMVFFLSSTLIGRIRRDEKEWLKKVHEKGGRRDAFQVLANGGMGMLTAALYGLTRDPAWAAGFAVSFASSNADTWASELGVLSRARPVSFLSFKPAERGISGGVTILGTAAAAGGAALIAVTFACANLALGVFPRGFLAVAGFVAAGGLVGSFVDSLLGATLQGQYAADTAEQGTGGEAVMVTERRRTDEGAPNRLVRGLAFVNNDAVNFASCAVVTVAAVLLARLLT
jgi:uncharacterized protein (TIGR00297 family)